MKKPLLLSLFIMCFAVALFAQDDGPDGPPDSDDPTPWGDPELPVDGGIGLLLAAGVGYGIKRLSKKD